MGKIRQKCEFCESVLSDKYMLKRHIETNRKCLKIQGKELDSKYNCEICKFQFASKQNLKNHQSKCKTEYICNICDEKFLNKNLLEQHSVLCLKIFKKQVKEKDKIIDKLISNPVTNIIDNSKNIIIKYEPILNNIPDDKYIEDVCKEKFDIEHFKNGLKGCADFVYKNIIYTNGKLNYYNNGDLSRNTSYYKEKDYMVKDINNSYLISKVEKPIIDNSDDIYNILINSRNIDTDMRMKHLLAYSKIKNIRNRKLNKEFTIRLCELTAKDTPKFEKDLKLIEEEARFIIESESDDDFIL